MMGHSRDVRFLKAAIWPDQYPPERLPEVAFAGRSNVGKSSLINTLVGRKGLARTSQTPGKTQLIQFYRVEERFLVVDLPGYGYAKVPEGIRRRWGPMVERYLSGRKALCLVVLLLDIRRIPSEQDLQLKSWLDQRSLSTLYVLTKADKVTRGKRSQQMRRIAETLGTPPEELLAFSARTREGGRVLWARVLGAVDGHIPKAG